MPFEPLRFVHAANLHLDHQLRGTGPVSDELRVFIEDATLTAYENVVTHCIHRQADFLLLTSNSFVEADLSLRARLRMLYGFSRLAEHDIRVFVLPGNADPPDAWQEIPNLPGNVTPFFSNSSEPVAFIRAGKVIASVSTGCIGADGDYQGSADSDRRRPFRIGLLHLPLASLQTGKQSAEMKMPEYLAAVPVDYLAMGGQSDRRSFQTNAGIAHSPGSSQGINPTDAGACGCSLVEVDAGGAVECLFLPTATVRWQSQIIEVNAGMDRENLLETMAATTQSFRREETEKAWLVRWVISGTGPLFERLRDAEYRQQTADLIDAHEPFDADLHVKQTVHLQPHQETAANASHDDRIVSDYLHLLDGDLPISSDSLENIVEEADLIDSVWKERIRSLISEVDYEAIATEAQRMGLDWLGKPSLPEGEGPS